VLDKTGTVATGTMSLVDISAADRGDRDEALHLVGSLDTPPPGGSTRKRIVSRLSGRKRHRLGELLVQLAQAIRGREVLGLYPIRATHSSASSEPAVTWLRGYLTCAFRWAALAAL